jgi:hypothetical protein
MIRLPVQRNFSADNSYTGKHMGLSFSVAVKAFELAARVLVTVRASRRASADPSSMVSMLEDVSGTIDRLAGSIDSQIARQLEQHQLAKLAARARVVRLALEMGDTAMLGPAVASITEQIEYSKQRLEEGRQEWFGPWMVAAAVQIEALHRMAASAGARAVVRREAENFRTGIVDYAGRFLGNAVDSPLVRTAGFLEGRNEDFLLDLTETGALQSLDAVSPARAGGRKAEASPTDGHTVKWPFPTR